MSAPSRRAALLGLLAATTMSGCGIRLEDDAPKLPLLPTREPIGGEDALLALLRDSAPLAAALTTDSLRPYAAGLATQRETLAAALRQRGVPADAVRAAQEGRDPSAGAGSHADSAGADSAAASPDASPDASADPSGAGSRGTDNVAPTVIPPADPAGSAAASAIAARELLPVAAADLRPMLAALAAQRATLAVAAGDRSPSPSSGGEPTADPAARPAAEPLARDRALAVLAATREAVYGLEVAAARASDSVREKAIDTLAQLRGEVLAQERNLDDDLPATPTAYRLPVRVRDNASATRLVRTLASGLVGAYAAQLPPAAEHPGELATLTDGLTAACLLARRWGVAPGAFPGMS